MRKRISAILLALAVMVTASPAWVLAETEADGNVNTAAAGEWTVEVTEVGTTEAVVEWYPPEDAEYEHSDDAVFRLTASNIDENSIVELTAKTDESAYDAFYEYSEDTGHYSYGLTELEPDMDYTVEVEYALNEDEEVSLGKSEEFTTEAEEPAVTEEEAVPEEEVAEEEAVPEEDIVEEEAAPEEEIVEEEAAPEEAAEVTEAEAEEADAEPARRSLFTWNDTDDGEEPVQVGEEAASEPITIDGLTYSKKGNKYVTLTWQLKQGEDIYTEDDTDNLEVYRGNSKGKNFSLQDVTIKFDASTYTYTAKVTGLKAGTKYTFKVKETVSKKTAKKLIKTEVAVANVKGFKALCTYNGVILKWKRVKGATSYTIKWKSGKKSGTKTIKKGTTVKWLHKLPKSLRNKKVKYTIVANKKGVGSSAQKTKVTGEAVRTAHITAYMSTDRVLTSHDSAAITHTFPKGYKIDAYGYDGGRYVFDYKGHQFMVKRITTYGSSTSQLDSELTYTKEEAESFVNRCGLKSSTGWLIWVNTYTQSIFVFRGSKGKWKLYKGPWDVCTGKSATPTPTGLTRIRDKSRGCYDPFPQTPWWCVCAAGFSIHGKAPYYPPMGAPASNGCVRNWTENAKWMYDNVPVNTAVYVF